MLAVLPWVLLLARCVVCENITAAWVETHRPMLRAEMASRRFGFVVGSPRSGA